jgi:protein-tyrosine phosphatase
MDHVYWVMEGQLAGRTGPLLAPWDLGELRDAGLQVIVSLNEEVDSESISRAGLHHYMFAIPPTLVLEEADMEILLEGVGAALPVIHGEIGAGRPVMVHCHAGMDRTGAMLASYLVRYLGLSASEAVGKVRSLRPGAMSAPGYEEAVHRFEGNEADRGCSRRHTQNRNEAAR